jgi:Tfp pilus assembly protein PilW
LLGGQVYAGQTRQLPIGQNETTAIFFGDVVTLNAAGNITKVTTTATATTIGVFLGVTYVDPNTSQPVFKQYYPGAVNVAGMKAYVQDDPDQLYKVAVVSADTTIGFLTQAAVGKNTSLVQNAGNTLNGDSRIAVLNTTDTETTLPMRVVDVVPETAIAGFAGSYTEVIVRFNFGISLYENAEGRGA